MTGPPNNPVKAITVQKMFKGKESPNKSDIKLGNNQGGGSTITTICADTRADQEVKVVTRYSVMRDLVQLIKIEVVLEGSDEGIEPKNVAKIVIDKVCHMPSRAEKRHGKKKSAP